MRRLSVGFTPESARLISRLSPEVKKLVRSSIDVLLTKSYAGSELAGELEGYRSYRARRYRIIYRVNQDESRLEIYHVGHRGDVYETLRSLLDRRS